jgi:hypothetical protein
MRKSRDWFSKKSEKNVRSSIASKVFMRRETESQYNKDTSMISKDVDLRGISVSEHEPQTKLGAISEYNPSSEHKPVLIHGL